MNIYLNALDTLFFRDGKPFSMGEETWANGFFPPPPSVMYGALRTAYLSENIAEMPNVNTDIDKTSNLKINYFSLFSNNKQYFPCPLDIVEKKTINIDENKYCLLQCKKNENYSNLDLSCILKANEDVIDVSGIISILGLNNYLINNTVPTQAGILDDYVIEESKVGIGRNNITNTSDDGMLYRVGMRRLQNMGFSVGFDGITLSSSGLIKIGGEGKAVSYSSLSNLLNPSMPASLSDKYFKLYLATPAFFHEGWKPSLPEKYGAELVAAVVGKPLYIGGFNLKSKDKKGGWPKPMRRAVPAGSVYYYKGELEKVKDLHGASISDCNIEQGFGITYIGDIKKEFIP